jgi:hypothetical protein
MSDNVASLAAARVLKTEDNTLWSPVECARQFILDVEEGRAKPKRLLMIWEEDLPDGRVDIQNMRCNMDTAYEAWLLSSAQYFAHKRGSDG